MLVSIVVPAFNEEQYIHRCLQALSRQYHPYFQVETIVVDGNSTDRTREIAHEYGVQVIVQQHRGIAQARQIGFEAAQGEIIASTDADSAPPPDWLMRHVEELQIASDVVGVYGPVRLYDGKGYEDFVTHYVAGTYLWANAVIKRPVFSGQNFAVRREAWARVGGFDTHWVSAEDVNLSLKLRRIGRVQFCWDIQVPTSRRRAREGYGLVIKHTLSNYLRVTWLNALPLPFTDIR